MEAVHFGQFQDLDDVQTGERKIEMRLDFSATVAAGSNLKEFLKAGLRTWGAAA